MSVTRTWVWIALAAGVFMIGYYLPTYRYVHMVPILNVVRCPSRMVLAVDMAQATLAALAVHYALVRKDDSFRRTVRRATTIVLPLIMLTGLAGMAAIAFFGNVPDFWEFFFTGTTPEAKQANAQAAFHVGNPAIWIPICLLVLTVLIVRLWTRRPTLWPVLLALLVADLFFITRFVDVPGAGARPQDPETSPAAAWLRENAPAGDYRIFSVGTGYYQRASELLLPKACHAMGFSSIASYGPFEHPRHAQLFGLSITGYSRDWPGLLRRNYLLSTANVRYIIGTEPVVREVLESVRIPESPPPADGPDLLGGADRGVGVSPADPSSSNSAERQAATSAQGKPSATGFELSNVTAADGVLRFQTPFMWRRCLASQNIEIKGDTVYRIGLDARGPEGGAANFLRAEVLGAAGGDNWDMTGLTIRQDEIGAPWRHFEWTFRSTADAAGERKFLLQSVSERPIEVRNVSLRESRIDAPLDPLRKLSPGQKVYRFRAEFPPLNAGDTPVFLYENLLARADIEPVSYMIRTQDELETSIERLKWDYPRSNPTAYEPPPSVAFTLFLPPYSALLLRTTLPATLVFAALATFFLVRSNRKCAVAPGRDNDDALP